MLRHVEWYAVTDVSNGRSAFIFKVKQSKNSTLLGLFDLAGAGTTIIRNVSYCIPPTRRNIPEDLYLSNTAVITSDLTVFCLLAKIFVTPVL
jgi:hypothetical protein